MEQSTSTGTLTLTLHAEGAPEEEKEEAAPAVGPYGGAAPAEKRRLVLRLKARRHISFSEDTVDNEHMHKKKSKRCCIFHKRREFGESSTESEYSTDDSEHSAKAASTWN